MASLVDRDSAQQHQQPRRQPPAAQQQQQSPTRSPVAAAASKTQRSASTGAAAANAASDTDKPASTAKVSRKRTKTGCLTCRKRRIKCGEQRPTCNNCIKSKRICEGYNQRVVFKNISGSLQGRPFPGNASPFPIQPAPGVALLQPIAPAPPSSLGYRDEPITPLDQSLPPHLREHYAARQGHSPQYQVPGVTVPLGPPSEYVVDYGRHQSLHSPASHGAEVEEDHYGGGYYTAPNSATGASFPGMHGHHGHGGGGTVSEPSSASIYGPPPFQSPHSAHFPTSSSYGHAHSAAASPVSCPFNPPMDPKYVLSGGESVVQGGGSEFGGLFAQQRNMPQGSMMPVPEEFVQMTRDYDMENDDDDDDEDEDDEMEDEDEEDDDYDEQYHGQDANTSEYDYGFFYVDPRRPAGSSSQQQKQQQQLSNRARMTSYLQPYAGALTSQSRVSFRSFLPDHGSLTTYQPTLSNSPLMNPTTAKIFCHFVYVLGPSMSIFERYPPNPHIAFSPGTAASPGADTAGQNVWSYTLPMMSLHHPALLHAILALSSLNISKLQRGPAHPSMLHYHIALRRLGRAIASDKMRGHVATLAATLLLAYYESMAGEHDKWSSHVHGAKQLLKEIDFQRVAQRVAEVDAEEGQETRTGQPWGGEDGQQNRALALMQKRRLRESNAPPAGRRGARQKWRDPSAPPSPKEAEQLQLQADMFWFFAKMDAFQSILSGCPLILDHIHWSQCPPRARTGTLGMTHGSSDHFFHLLGKIADFQVRDAQRKKAVMRANGGVWIPPPDLRPPGDTSSAGPPPASSGCGRGNSTSSRGGTPPNLGRGATPPDMAGLIPTSHPPRLSRFFAENLPAASQPSPPHTSAPLPDSAAELSPLTAAAEREWAQLQSLLREYEASLGYEFRELKIEYAPLTSTPFGPPLYFRTYPIATLHMMLHMAHIILLRCHPSMPASIPMAIGVAAPRAALHALAIGQILAGLTPNAPLPSSPSTTTTATSSASTTHFFTNAAHQQITPALGGALIESTLPILFAAMQYQDATQRRWTVRRLREIHRLTGWATATRVMLGCQRAWEAAGRAGRGPKYEREAFADDEEGRLWEYGLSRAEAAREQVDMLVRGGGGGGGGAGGAGFMWRVSAARAARAVGVLGDEEEVVVGVAEISL